MNIKVFKPGVFDIMHLGHVRSIQKASSCGDYLVVGVQDDREVKKCKGDFPVTPLSQRMEIVGALKGVDEVISYRSSDLCALLSFCDIGVLSVADDYGNDQSFPEQCKTIDFCDTHGIKIVRSERLQNISSSSIKDYVKKFWQKDRQNKNETLESSTMLTSFSGNETALKQETNIELSLIAKYTDDNQSILDLGCGYGRLAIPLSKICKRVVAVDFSENLLDHLVSQEIPNIETQLCNCTDYIPNEIFDAMLLSGVLPCVNDEELLQILQNTNDKIASKIIIRSSISITDRRVDVINQYSEALNDLYTAFYRTKAEIDHILAKFGRYLVEYQELYQNQEDTKVSMFIYQ
jgi:glycerol-3-phosphate cytidylyltransferase